MGCISFVHLQFKFRVTWFPVLCQVWKNKFPGIDLIKKTIVAQESVGVEDITGYLWRNPELSSGKGEVKISL